jgi:hypothetical protein
MTRLGLGISINQSVVGSSKAPASLSFSPNPNLVYNPGTVISFSANSNSPGAITYQSDNPSVIFISGNKGTVLTSGKANITAFVAETPFYYSTYKAVSITISPITSTINFLAPISGTYGINNYVSVITNSPNTVTYLSDNPSVISISGNNLLMVGVGTANITASIAGGNNYSAVSATKTITVSKGIPTISFSVPSQLDTNAAPFSLNPTSNSPGAITYTSSNPSVISISGNTATVIGNGQAFINVQVASTTNYNFTSATYSITVAPSSAPTWTPYRITGSAFGQYQTNEYVWYSGNIYKCLAANDGIVPTNTVYWQLIKSGSLTFDTDANTWFTNVAAVSSVSSANQISINAFFASLKQGGVWNAIHQANLFVGPADLSGALIPLNGNSPTNTGFVAQDYNYLTGLIGNKNSKYLVLNRANNADASAASRHMYVCATSMPTATTQTFLIASGNTGGDSRISISGTGTISMNMSSANQVFGYNTVVNGFGMNHNGATSVVPYVNGNQGTVTGSIPAQTSTSFTLFATPTGGGKTDARIAFYSIGDSADCSIIDACVKTLLSALV